MFFYRALCAACFLACFFSCAAFAHHVPTGGGGKTAGPIITTTASTLPQGQLFVSLTEIFTRSDRFSDAQLIALAGQHVHAHSVDWTLISNMGMCYGLLPDLTISLNVPLVHRNGVRAGSHSHAGGVAINEAESFGDVASYGDFTAIGQYQFFSHDVHQAAIIFGLKMPTGETDLSDHDEVLEAEHQPGSGSWDPMAGFAAGTRRGPYAIDASVIYTRAGDGAQNANLGDRFQYNIAISRRIGGELHNHGEEVHQHEAWDFALELNGEWSGEQSEDGEIEEDSDENVIFLSPGVRYLSGEQWSAYLSVGVPVVDSHGRGHADTDFKVTTGVGMPF